MEGWTDGRRTATGAVPEIERWMQDLRRHRALVRSFIGLVFFSARVMWMWWSSLSLFCRNAFFRFGNPITEFPISRELFSGWIFSRQRILETRWFKRDRTTSSIDIDSFVVVVRSLVFVCSSREIIICSYSWNSVMFYIIGYDLVGSVGWILFLKEFFDF